MKLKSNKGYFQSVKENRRAGADYNITGQSAQTKAIVSSPSSMPEPPYLANLTK